MKIRNFFIFRILDKVKQNLPDFVTSNFNRLIPVYFITSILEIFSLVILVPVINSVLTPEYINKNTYLNYFYETLNFSSHFTFVLMMFVLVSFIFTLKNILYFIVLKYQSKLSFEMAIKIAQIKFNSYLEQNFQFHSDNNTAVLLRNFAQIPFELISYVVIPCVVLLNEFFVLFLLTAGILIINPIMCISLFIFASPLFYLYNKKYRGRLQEISSIKDTSSKSLYLSGQQTMETFREVVIFDKKEFFKPIFKKAVTKYGDVLANLYLINAFSPKIVETFAVICLLVIFTVGYMLNKNIQELAQFLIFFCLAVYRIIPSINKIILNMNYIKSSAYTLDYFTKKDFESADESIIQKETSSEKIKFTESISIRGLSFAYQGSKNSLNNINIHIPKGKTIGIVGPSGSGKTTLLNILLRLYIEDKGGIYIDNTLISSENIKDWYKTLSYVPQNISLLDSSILENICFGISPDEIDHELLHSVINKAQLTEFVNSLPSGVNTQIGEKGIKISGGQRQRIGIARALYHNGDVLIFDEATSSLDAETEMMLTDSISSLSHKEFTIIIVAHRIQTLKYCDLIYTLKDGQLSEKPQTYAELLSESYQNAVH